LRTTRNARGDNLNTHYKDSGGLGVGHRRPRMRKPYGLPV